MTGTATEAAQPPPVPEADQSMQAPAPSQGAPERPSRPRDWRWLAALGAAVGLAAMLSRLGRAAACTPPMPYRLFKLAEVHW